MYSTSVVRIHTCIAAVVRYLLLGLFAGLLLTRTVQAQQTIQDPIYSPSGNGSSCPLTSIVYQLPSGYDYQAINWIITQNANNEKGTILQQFTSDQGTPACRISWTGDYPDAILTVTGQYKLPSASSFQSFPTGYRLEVNILPKPAMPTAISSTPSITSNTFCVVANQPYTYQVPNTSGSFEWDIPTGNGTILSGQGTRSIQVQWAQTGATATATLRVRQKSTACTDVYSAYQSVSYTIISTPVLSANAQLTGTVQVCANTAYIFALNGTVTGASNYSGVQPIRMQR